MWLETFTMGSGLSCTRPVREDDDMRSSKKSKTRETSENVVPEENESVEASDISSYIKSKNLKTRENVNVHIHRSLEVKDDQTITKFSAKRQGDSMGGDIVAMEYSLVKDKVTGRVVLKGLEIHVKSLFEENPRIADICQLQNGTYICSTFDGNLLKLDCFYEILDIYIFPKICNVSVCEHICATDANTVAVMDRHIRGDWIVIFSVKNDIDFLVRFNVTHSLHPQSKVLGLACIDEMLCVISNTDVHVFTRTGQILKTFVELPFTFTNKACIRRNSQLLSYVINRELKIREVKGEMPTYKVSDIPEESFGFQTYNDRIVFCDANDILYFVLKSDVNDVGTLVKTTTYEHEVESTFRVKCKKCCFSLG